MDCTEFLHRYTDFRDGLITYARELRRFERHRARCATCRKYDAAVRRGVEALQAAGTIEPSPDFRRLLEERLRGERLATTTAGAGEGGPALSAWAGLAAALFVAVALSLLALEGRSGRAAVARAPELPPVPFPKPVAQAGVPFVSFQDPRASVVAGNPNPYGTALVEPASAGR